MTPILLWLDLLGGALIPVGLIAAYRLQIISKPLYQTFWVGVLFGLVWETAAHLVDGWVVTEPLVIHMAEWPLPMLTMPLIQSLWDGLLFATGVVIIRSVCTPPHFDRWQWGEWAVFAAWGVGSCLVVEALAAFTQSWHYGPRFWNPVLLTINDVPVTLLPLALWAVAATLFYTLMLARYEKEKR